jgi:hypothetical protein
MLTRGRNPNILAAERYVLRGITVAAEWLPGGDDGGFSRFLAHVGDRPSAAHSIDRIDNDRPYEPGNVRWAVKTEQANNTCSNVLIEYEGASMTIAQAARAAGMKAQTIRDRIRLGWPADKLTAPRARAPFGLGRHSRPGVLPR